MEQQSDVKIITESNGICQTVKGDGYIGVRIKTTK